MINEKVKNTNVTDIIKTPKKSMSKIRKAKEYVRALRQNEIVFRLDQLELGKHF